MYEMLEIVKRLLLLGSLLYFAWQDYHTHYISVVAAVITGIIGIGMRFLIEGNMVVRGVLVSMIVGLGLIIISVVFRESIGLGDGILFLVSGCYMNIFENMILLVRTIFLTGGFAFLCLVIGKIKEGARIPMAPFMLAAYVTIL